MTALIAAAIAAVATCPASYTNTTPEVQPVTFAIGDGAIAAEVAPGETVEKWGDALSDATWAVYAEDGVTVLASGTCEVPTPVTTAGPVAPTEGPVKTLPVVTPVTDEVATTITPRPRPERPWFYGMDLEDVVLPTWGVAVA